MLYQNVLIRSMALDFFFFKPPQLVVGGQFHSFEFFFFCSFHWLIGKKHCMGGFDMLQQPGICVVFYSPPIVVDTEFVKQQIIVGVTTKP